MVQLVATGGFYAARTLLCEMMEKQLLGANTPTAQSSCHACERLSWELLPGYQGWSVLIDGKNQTLLFILTSWKFVVLFNRSAD